MALATHILMVFDSRYGHIDTMAEAVAAGSGQAGNIEVTPVQVAELMPHEVLDERSAKAARAALPRASGQGRAVGGRRGYHLDALMAITASLNDDKSSKHLGGVFRSEVVEFGDMPTQPQEEMVMEDSPKHSINNAGQSASVGLIIRLMEPTNIETPCDQLDAFLTPTELFYIRSHFPTPQGELASYHLRIDGAVRHPSPCGTRC
jgi:hypothetical protein